MLLGARMAGSVKLHRGAGGHHEWHLGAVRTILRHQAGGSEPPKLDPLYDFVECPLFVVEAAIEICANLQVLNPKPNCLVKSLGFGHSIFFCAVLCCHLVATAT